MSVRASDMTRRRFLRAMGWGTAGVTLFLGGCARLNPLPVLPHRGDPSAEDAAVWLSLRPEGHVELVLPRAELGQGIASSMRQIVAEELGLPMDRVKALMPRSDRLPPVRATVGSDSIKDFGGPVASAAAALSAALRHRAAERLGITADGIVSSDAGYRSADGRTVSLAELAVPALLLDAAAIASARPVSFAPGVVRTHVGRSQPTERIHDIVTAGGGPIFTDDVRLPGMVFGAMIRPARLGARLTYIDDKAVRDMPGYLGLVRADGRAGVLAEGRGALARILAEIRSEWTGPAVTQAALDRAVDVDAGLAAGPLEHVERDAEIAAGETFDLDLRLDVPMAAHAPMEPKTAVARFNATGPLRLEIWTGTQDVTFVHQTLARHFGLATGDVAVYGMRVGGGFGGKTLCQVELEAALLARAAGRPVKVQWSRSDEFQVAFHRPPSSHRIRARLGSDGEIDAWWHAFRSGHVIFTSVAMGPVLQFVTSFAGDPGVLRGALPPYAATRQRIEFEDVRLPVDTGPWRGLGASPNSWAVETAIDALARKAGEDPVAFRRARILPREQRLVRVLDAAASAADWSRRKSGPARGYGVACGIYKEMSYAAVIAEVERSPGSAAGFRVTRLWAAHDCGQIVNPDLVRAQIEGNLVWGIGMALHEGLTLAEGRIGADSYGDYPVPRFSDVPEIGIVLVEEGEPASGAGETAIVAGTAAITNAIAAMTGNIVTRLPVSG